jgi:hypothetical protein
MRFCNPGKIYPSYTGTGRLRAMQHSAESIFVIEYLREYESIFETTLAYESVDPVVLFDAKKPEV